MSGPSPAAYDPNIMGGLGANTSGKPGFIPTPFGGLQDVNVGQGLSLTSLSPLAKNIPALGAGTGKAGGLADKFLQAIMGLGADFQKAAQGAGVMYSGDLPSGTSVSSSAPSVGGSMQIE